MKLLTYISIITLFLLESCNPSEQPYPYKDETTPNYIVRPVEVFGLNPHYTDWNYSLMEYTAFGILIDSAEPDWSGNYDTAKSDWNFQRPEKEKYQPFYESIGDTAFNDSPNKVFKNPVFIEPVSAIRVSVDRSYLLQGASDNEDITDLIRLYYLHPGLYTMNGYSNEGIDLDPGQPSTMARLDDFNKKGEKKGLADYFYFQLLEAPIQTDTFTFHIALEFANGDVFETNTPPAIIKGLE